eukprot:SAG31_NODE_11058_length_1070_cov_1.465499_2_plen_66_part_01
MIVLHTHTHTTYHVFGPAATLHWASGGEQNIIVGPKTHGCDWQTSNVPRWAILWDILRRLLEAPKS